MSETVNIHETGGRSLTVGLPGFELENTRRALIATRIKHGANTPIGHRCSNIVEMLESGAPPTMIVKQMNKLAQLLMAA